MVIYNAHHHLEVSSSNQEFNQGQQDFNHQLHTPQPTIHG